MIDLKVLGAVEARVSRPDGRQTLLTQPKRLALLTYLALAEPAGFHSRERLLALFWPDADDRSSRHSLRNALHALRALGDDAVTTRGEGYVGLDFSAFRCDALDLRSHLAAGRVEDGFKLWRGDLAPGFHVSGAPEFERWLDEQRADLRRAMREAAWGQAKRLAGTGRAELDAVSRIVQLDPGDEPGVRRLMRVLADAGNRAGALRAYDELTDYLARELDVEPSAETRALAAGLRVAEVVETSAPKPRAELPISAQPPSPSSRSPSSSPAAERDVRPPSSAPSRRGARIAVAGGLLTVLALFLGPFLMWRSATATPSGTQDSEAERAVSRLPRRYRDDTSLFNSYKRALTLRFDQRFTASRDSFAALVYRQGEYVPGLYGLAHAYIFMALNGLTDPDETWTKADWLARRALALDSTAASAWLVLASEDMYVTLDLSRARERIARAMALDSLDPDAAGMRSTWFRFHGDMDSAVAEARRAHRLDPMSRLFSRGVAKQLFYARRYEESRKAYFDILEEDPGWTRAYADLTELYRAMGRPRDAVAWLRRARAVAGDSAAAAALYAVDADSAAVRLLAADARRTIERLDRSARTGGRVAPGKYAAAYASLGDTAGTLRWLDSISAHRDSWLNQVRVDPAFDFLRELPQYRAWDARSGLPQLTASVSRR